MTDVNNIADKKFNVLDKKHFGEALYALRYSDSIDCVTLLKEAYRMPFSKEPKISGSVSSILDSFFSGEESEQAEYLRKTAVSKEEIIYGDFVLCENDDSARAYVYCDDKAVAFSCGSSECSIDELTSEMNLSKRCAAFRPSRLIPGIPSIDSQLDEATLTQAQRALISTANAYFLRGYRCQYDDTRFTDIRGCEFRWQIGIKNPEDYTADKWGYLNCAAFTYELYRVALGMDLGMLFTTYNLMKHYTENGFTEGEPFYPYYYAPTHSESEEEKAKVEKEFKQKLSVGDLIVVRRKNGSGHVMMYVGNGMVIHSGGANYKYSEAVETHEPTVMYMDISQYFFDPEARNYIFDETGFVTQLGIIRPLDKFEGEIPQNTLNRMKNLNGIFAEKLSSASGGRTVNTGELIRYTFNICNTGDDGATLEIRDVLGPAVEYVSGEGTFDGNCFSTVICVSAKEEKSVSYTVRVIGKNGDVISGEGATVGGVSHRCCDVHIEKTLTESDAKGIVDSVKSMKKNIAEEITDFALANAIYERAGLCKAFDSIELCDIEKGLFVQEEFFTLRADGEYSNMLIPGLFGGRKLQTPNLYAEKSKMSSNRVRLLRLKDFVAGDIIISKTADIAELYIYTGCGEFVNLSKLGSDKVGSDAKAFIEGLLACGDYFVALRPSMAM